MKKISQIITERLQNANIPFNSTDNISDFLNDNERSLLIEEIEQNVELLLKSLIINTKDDHNTKETAHRISKMYIDEIFRGRYYPAPKITSFPNTKTYDQLYVTGPIEVHSVCAHHFQNISGKAYIGVFPGSNVIGLSKFNRIVDWYSARPTIQEELTVQIADEVVRLTAAKGVGVLIKAKHDCMIARGVKAHENDFTTSVVRGTLRTDPILKDEFFRILSGMKGWNA